ncbi:MAG: adenosine deaminase family protein, partial [Deltaproteobacteria bacterium]|nr:adenosine deaminase family protein [Deltaproteobacteria bacterium]
AVLAGLVELAADRPGVVAIDLAGGPAPKHDWSLADYRGPFAAAAELGLGRTVHAAEGRPAGEITTAIEELGAQRIGHGTTLMDDPEVLGLVLERGVTIEACPTSNVHTGAIASVAAHPLRRWLGAGVRVCVCPDNTLLSNVSAAQELARVCRDLDLSPAERQQLIDNGHRAAFPTRQSQTRAD